MQTGIRYRSLAAVAACALGVAPIVDAQPGAASEEHATESATLEKLRQTRDARSTVAEFEAALHPALQIVAGLEGREDFDVSDDLLRLARIQAGLEDYDAAEINYLRAIEMLEDAQGIFSPALIAPYHALGRTYMDSRRFDEALVALERAQLISQRDQGLFNLEQLALIDDMTRAQLESGNAAAAHALQRERLDTAIRRFGPDTPELIPFYRHLGDYYDRSWYTVRARDQYRIALEISKARFGDSSPESVELLRRLIAVELKLNHRTEARDRLLAALDTATDISPEERGMSLAVIGDWAIVNGQHASAKHFYSEAYNALQESDDAEADDFLATPIMLDFVPPRDEVRATKFRPWSWGRIELAFDVSASGRASDVRTVSMKPVIDDLESDYGEQIREARFRPGLEEGRPVARSDVSYTGRFRYYVRD